MMVTTNDLPKSCFESTTGVRGRIIDNNDCFFLDLLTEAVKTINDAFTINRAFDSCHLKLIMACIRTQNVEPFAPA